MDRVARISDIKAPRQPDELDIMNIPRPRSVHSVQYKTIIFSPSELPFFSQSVHSSSRFISVPEVN